MRRYLVVKPRGATPVATPPDPDRARFGSPLGLVAGGVLVAVLVLLVGVLIDQEDPAPVLRVEIGARGRPGVEFDAFYPEVVTARRGDVIEFWNTSRAPHTVTFGVDPDRADQPSFGAGTGPLSAVVDRCAAARPLRPSDRACPRITPRLPEFDGGQAYYNSGIIEPGRRFRLPLLGTLEPGRYPFVCLIHPAQQGVLVVEGDRLLLGNFGDTPRPGDQDSLDRMARRQRAADRREVAALEALTGRPAAPRTVRAGLDGEDAGRTRFFPDRLVVPAGESVTWVNGGAIPHVVVFDDTLRPLPALFAAPSVPSGGRYAGGPATSGPLGVPPYPRERWSLSFPVPGTYRYACALHPGMTGVVQVR